MKDVGIAVAQGTGGMAATFGPAIVSMMAQAEAWLRLVSLVVGIAIGVATFISIIRRMRAKRYRFNYRPISKNRERR